MIAPRFLKWGDDDTQSGLTGMWSRDLTKDLHLDVNFYTNVSSLPASLTNLWKGRGAVGQFSWKVSEQFTVAAEAGLEAHNKRWMGPEGGVGLTFSRKGRWAKKEGLSIYLETQGDDPAKGRKWMLTVGSGGYR